MISLSDIVEYFPETENNACGYCKSENGSICNGMWAHSLSVRNYQDLLNRGWRRSGKYCYKPVMKNTCCPLYTIKCDAVNFNLTKSQKKILRRVAKFLREGSAPKCEKEESGHGSSSGYLSERKMLAKLSKKCGKSIEVSKHTKDDTVSELTMSLNRSSDVSKTTHSSGIENTKSETTTTSTSSSKTIKKAKEIRLERKIRKMEERGESTASLTLSSRTPTIGKSLENFLVESVEGDVKNNLVLRLVPSSLTPELLNISWQLYVKYQMVVHKEKEDECSFSSFKQFLVDTPLQFHCDDTSPSCGFGSFHHQYWLNGVLIAVGVIDILPECVSSVYFFYDPAYSHLSLGTYGALREIELTRSLSKQCPSITSYYMGYYIDTCPKMNYKGRFGPSYLLCPEAYTWHPLEECLKKIQEQKYAKFNNLDAEAIPGNVNPEKVVILWRRKVMEYKQFLKNAKPDRKEINDIQTYANLIGENCCLRTLLYKNLNCD